MADTRTTAARIQTMVGGRSLAQALCAAGLQPPDILPPAAPGVAPCRLVPEGGCVEWTPHQCIQDCWYLVERYHMTIMPAGEGHWHVQADNGVYCPRLLFIDFAAVPDAVCRLALACLHREDLPHA
jgi:hypothetical protein